MKILTYVFISTMLIFNLNSCGGSTNGGSTNTQTPTNTMTSDDQRLQEAFKNKEKDVQVHGEGKVTKLLDDDTFAPRHQRFILTLSSGQTLLIAHNIDIAASIDTLAIGDSIEFYGEYVWNNQGGLVHRTHRDDNHKHLDGYLKHKDATYQ